MLPLLSTRNPASRASKRLRLVAIRASSYVHRICNFKDCKEGIYFMFFQRRFQELPAVSIFHVLREQVFGPPKVQEA